MCGGGGFLQVLGTVASVVTGNPIFSAVGNTVGGKVSASSEKKKASAAAANANAAVEAQRQQLAATAEKKRKARLPTETVFSQQTTTGTLG